MKPEHIKKLKADGTIQNIVKDEIGTYYIIKETIDQEGIPTRFCVAAYEKGKPGFELQKFYATKAGELRRISRPLLNWNALQTIRAEDMIQKAITIIDYLS